MPAKKAKKSDGQPEGQKAQPSKRLTVKKTPGDKTKKTAEPSKKRKGGAKKPADAKVTLAKKPAKSGPTHKQGKRRGASRKQEQTKPEVPAEGGNKVVTSADEKAMAKTKKKKYWYEKKNKGRLVGAKAAKLQALNAQKAIVKGRHVKKRKPRYQIRFRRPKTLELPRNPKYPRLAIPKKPQLHTYNVLTYPLANETAMKKTEDYNTIVFLADLKANKNHIKAVVKKLYDIKVDKIHTLITPLGKKKAYIRLSKEHEALDVANKIGII